MTDIMGKLFSIFQYLLPHHLLSRLAARLAEARLRWFKNLLIRLFVRQYGVDLNEAKHQNLELYSSFNDFFTRPLQSSARPIYRQPGSIISPADGTLSQYGNIVQGRLIQAKNRAFSAEELVGEPTTAAQFSNGKFITIYLSPRDYHRVHMPASGKLIRSLYIPGRLFSVNKSTTDHIPNLFTKNERLVCVFECSFGPLVVVFVGAMLVAGIESTWQKSYKPGELRAFDHLTEQLHFETGDEVGRFKFGSTVIMLFPEQVIFEPDLVVQTPLKMGESIAMA
jgi:phosphatidylserine decarboxylase